MAYFEMLKDAFKRTGFSLSYASEKLKERGMTADKAYLSRLQNGKTPPASDRLNEALAEVLGIDPVELKVAAYREKIPPEILERINSTA